MKASGAQWIGMKTIGCPNAFDEASVCRTRNVAALSSSGQQLVLVAIEILHHAGGAAEIIGEEVVRRHRGGDVGHGVTLRRHALGEVGVMAGPFVDYLGRLYEFLQRRAHARSWQTCAPPADQAEIVQAGQIG